MRRMRLPASAAFALAAAAVLCVWAPASAWRAGGGLPDLGVRDPRLTRLFTPSAAPAGTYEVFRSPRPIAAVAAELRSLDPAPRADAWRIAPLGPGDALGSSAPYDASKVARLYLADAPMVARGSLRTPEGVVGFTLISPWPDADLASLQPGTMTIVVHVTTLTGLR
jgi:hypothetical protein